MLRSLFVGAILTFATVGVHVVGTMWLIGYLRRLGEKAATRETRFARQLWILCMTALLLLSLHILEVVIWATTYLALPIDDIANAEQAVYFSTVSFCIARLWRFGH